MRIKFDEHKRQQVLKNNNRRIDFLWFEELLCLPYIEDQRNDDPEQYRIIGFAKGRLRTFIVEYRHDTLGEFIWIVTAWNATKQEEKAYEKNTK